MKTKLLFLSIPLIVMISLGACSRPQEEQKSASEIDAATATAQSNLSGLPPEIPINEGGYNFSFAAENTYISYEVDGAFDTIVEYYRTELEALGWEKKNNSNETALGEALTLLRSRPDKNISVTIQQIPQRETVRILITVINK